MGGTRGTGQVRDRGSRDGIWHPRYAWVTAGAVAMIFLAATQALAVTTVMPVVSADLDGAALYAVAFAGTLATSVIGMVAVGAWCDRRDPVLPLATAVALFVVGLVIAGAAPTMEVLVAGRLLQGLGTGGETVALYVVVARVYPGELHGRVFAAFSAAWVVPSLIGPFLAGAVTDLLHWRWVFLGVAALTLIAFTIVYLRLHGLALAAAEPSRAPVAARLVWASLLAIGALALSLAGETGGFAPWVIGVAIVLIVVAVRPLVPAGTLSARRGLPSVVLMRGLIAGALFGAEIYVPHLLIEDYGFASTWAGLGLTAAALLWALCADIQGRYGDRIGNTRIAIVGVALLAGSIAATALAAAGHVPAWMIIVTWGFAGAGMGLMYPRLTVLTLAYSTPQNQGFNSAALSIFDAVGAAAAIAAMGLVFVALTATGAGYPVVLLLGSAAALAALLPGLRLGRAHEQAG